MPSPPLLDATPTYLTPGSPQLDWLMLPSWVHMTMCLPNIQDAITGEDGQIPDTPLVDFVLAAVMPFVIFFSTVAMRPGELYGLTEDPPHQDLSQKQPMFKLQSIS